MLNGFKNEFDFCRIFNDKFCYQLDDKYIRFLNYIYERKIDTNAYMICYKNVRQEKVDIILRVGNLKKVH